MVSEAFDSQPVIAVGQQLRHIEPGPPDLNFGDEDKGMHRARAA